MSSEQQPSVQSRTVFRAAFAGLVLAGIGIGLFIVTWDVLGSFEVPDAPRLFASICIPPAGIAAILGIFLLTVRPSQGDETSNPSNEDGTDDAHDADTRPNTQS